MQFATIILRHPFNGIISVFSQTCICLSSFSNVDLRSQTRCWWPTEAILAQLVSVICEKCSKRYPRNKFRRNFPSYTRKVPSLFRSCKNHFFSHRRLSLFSLSLSFFSRSYNPTRKPKNETWEKKALSERWRATGYNFISYHETNERLLWDASVGRKISSRARVFGNNNASVRRAWA